MNESGISALASIAGMFVTGLFGYLVSKHRVTKDLTLDARQQLSKDEHQFRAEIYERMKILQEQVDKNQQKVDVYHRKIITLEDAIVIWKNKYIELDREWRTKYVELQIENKHLNNKIYVLEKHLRGDDYHE